MKNKMRTYAIHFEYAEWLHSGHLLAMASWPCWISKGPADAVRATLHHRPGAVILKITSTEGEILGYAPGGIAA